MSKADIIQLVADISLAQADTIMAERYFDDIVNGLGEREVIVGAHLIPVIADTAVYELPDDTIDLLGVFYGDMFLNEAPIQEVESFAGLSWRSRRGTPIAYVVEQESSRDFRLFPTPDQPSSDIDFAFGSPFGHDYPEGVIAALCSEKRDELPEWLELPIAFEILAREYARESDHQNKAFSEVCRITSAVFLTMVM